MRLRAPHIDKRARRIIYDCGMIVLRVAVAEFDLNVVHFDSAASFICGRILERYRSRVFDGGRAT